MDLINTFVTKIAPKQPGIVKSGGKIYNIMQEVEALVTIPQYLLLIKLFRDNINISIKKDKSLDKYRN